MQLNNDINTSTTNTDTTNNNNNNTNTIHTNSNIVVGHLVHRHQQELALRGPDEYLGRKILYTTTGILVNNIVCVAE